MVDGDSLYQYLQVQLENQRLQYPWRVTLDDNIQEVELEVFIPIHDEIKAAPLFDSKQRPIQEIDYIQVAFIYNLRAKDWITSDFNYYIAPLKNVDYYEQGYVDISIYALSKVVRAIESQMLELAHGRIDEIKVVWPSELVANMIKDRKQINRYEIKRLYMTKEN